MLPRLHYMARKKRNLEGLITEKAKALFIARGYSGLTMRELARECHTSLGNIYTYYGSKDELFQRVLTPILNAFSQLIQQHNREDRLDLSGMQRLNLEMIEQLVELIDTYGDELHLLLFSAKGSRYEYFVDSFIEEQVVMGTEYIKLLHERNPQVNTHISETFIRLRSQDVVALLAHMVRARLPKAQREQTLHEYATYSLAGWQALLLPETN